MSGLLALDTNVSSAYANSGSMSNIGDTNSANRIHPRIEPWTVPRSRLNRIEYDPSMLYLVGLSPF
jgi:hypothetical protein